MDEDGQEAGLWLAMVDEMGVNIKQPKAAGSEPIRTARLINPHFGDVNRQEHRVLTHNQMVDVFFMTLSYMA